jgi:hypothetical protein
MFGPARKITALLISICVLLTGCGHGPSPDDTIRNAYAWYVRELKSGVNPLEQKRTELQQFVTEGFLTSIDNMRPELEASPFMDAQSFDARLSIEKITKNSRAATVRIGLSGRMFGQHKLNVYLVKVEGSWKIDDVKMVEEFSLIEKAKNLAAVKSPHSNLLPVG